MINHINVADENGQVYCCLRNRVVVLDDTHKTQYCNGCRMYNGSAEGRGVECLWDDMREPNGGTSVLAEDPHSEWVSNQERNVSTDWGSGATAHWDDPDPSYL